MSIKDAVQTENTLNSTQLSFIYIAPLKTPIVDQGAVQRTSSGFAFDLSSGYRQSNAN